MSTGDNKPGLRDIRSLRERLGMLNKVVKMGSPKRPVRHNLKHPPSQAQHHKPRGTSPNRHRHNLLRRLARARQQRPLVSDSLTFFQRGQSRASRSSQPRSKQQKTQVNPGLTPLQIHFRWAITDRRVRLRSCPPRNRPSYRHTKNSRAASRVSCCGPLLRLSGSPHSHSVPCSIVQAKSVLRQRQY